MVVPGGRRAHACACTGLALTILSVLFPIQPLQAATRTVAAGGDLQAALNAAQPGDVVVLEAGARFVGNFRLPAKPTGPVITIKSSATLPNRRLTPADASLLPTLASATAEPALAGVATANWKLDGIRFEPTKDGLYNIVHLQDATNITMDRLLIVGGSQGQRRAIMGNGQSITLTRSHIANIWKSGEDSQAFCAWDGAGPYTIRDNYLEAASENVMFGGANSGSPSRIPSDILVENNHFSKPLEWKGKPRVVKNLFELKSARRVVVRNNLFERNWTDGQNGYAILFTVRNDEGGSPWSVVEDVLFERNIVRDTENGINVLGYDSYQPSGRTTRITIRHNLILTTGVFLQVGSEAGQLTLDHNTVDQGYNFATLYKGAVWEAGKATARMAQFAAESLTITNTLANHGAYGVIGEDAGIGTSALTQLTRGYYWTHNVLAGESGWGQVYPPVTWQPGMAEHEANFNSDYTLISSSAYRNAATDGQDLGAAMGSSSPPPPPPPAEICGDKIDNDGDGLVDEGCPTPQEVCGDGIDNDGDGQIDEGCTAPPAELCGDLIDNDGDGLIDEGCVATPPDTTGPTITLWNVVQTRQHLKLRVEASDPSGVASIKVAFNGSVVTTATTSTVNVTVPLQKVKPGNYELKVTGTDRVGNVSVLSRTIVRQ